MSCPFAVESGYGSLSAWSCWATKGLRSLHQQAAGAPITPGFLPTQSRERGIWVSGTQNGTPDSAKRARTIAAVVSVPRVPCVLGTGGETGTPTLHAVSHETEKVSHRSASPVTSE
eukprot:m.368583 g.368583  ORF g.368583 m.368583 type:complete len:116 (+) comp16666_c1_seq56:1932-2279(+)